MHHLSSASAAAYRRQRNPEPTIQEDEWQIDPLHPSARHLAATTVHDSGWQRMEPTLQTLILPERIPAHVLRTVQYSHETWRTLVLRYYGMCSAPREMHNHSIPAPLLGKNFGTTPKPDSALGIPNYYCKLLLLAVCPVAFRRSNTSSEQDLFQPVNKTIGRRLQHAIASTRGQNDVPLGQVSLRYGMQTSYACSLPRLLSLSRTNLTSFRSGQ